MGIDLDSQDGGLNALSGFVKGNKIFGAEGNGVNLFVIGTHYTASDLSDYTGMVIEENDIYGSNRAGIEVAGGITGLTIRNNTVLHNGYIWNGSNYIRSNVSNADPTKIMYGLGVNLIRTKSIASSGDNLYSENVTVQGNTINNNEKVGIYTGPLQDGLSITGNTIEDNGWDGIWFDESGTYHSSETYAERYGYMKNVTVENNTISGATGTYAGVKVTGSPASLDINNNDITGNANGVIQEDAGAAAGYIVNAVNNWWGSESGPKHATTNPDGLGDEVSDDVLYSPWLGNNSDDPHDEDNNWTFYVDGSNPNGIKEAIDNAIDGDIIVVNGGISNAIVVNKELTLIGTNGAEINNGSPAIEIRANNVTVDGFTFNFQDDFYAIRVYGDRSDIVVKNCIFNNKKTGGASPGLGIRNDNGGPYYVDASINNDWGTESGPTHATANPGGTGVIITDYVIYEWEGLLYPANSITGMSLEPEFTWGALAASPSVSYKLTISKNEDLSGPIFEENVGTATTFKPNETLTNFPLENNTKYHWQVTALDGDNNEIFESEVFYLTTVSNINVSLANPANKTKLYAYDPATFTWYISQATGSLKFYLQIKAGSEPGATDWYNDVEQEMDDGSINFFYDDLSSLYKNVNGLSGGTRYYWRIVTYFDDGNTPGSFDFDDRVVKYSPVFYFDTQGGAVTAYPSWPISGNTEYSLTPTFYWYTMQYEPSAEYKVFYSTSNSLDGSGKLVGAVELDAGSNLYVQAVSDLNPSTTYYWQVETTYGTEVKYSNVASFKTYDAPGLVPTKPTLSYPTDGITIYTTSPTLYWYTGAAVNAGSFEVEISSDGGSTWSSAGTTSETYLQISGLSGGVDYTWKVTHTVGGDSEPSDEAEFNVAGGMGSSVVLSYPTGGTTVYSNTPSLSWYVDGSTLDWDAFIVRWKKGSNSTDWASNYEESYTTSDIYEAFYTITTELEYGETYSWAVALYDGSTPPAHDKFSSSSFKVTGGNVIIYLSSPTNNSVVGTKSPSFYWYISGSNMGVTHYRVTYSNTELFTANVETVTSTTTSADVNGPLTQGSSYWWYVELSYDGGSTWENKSATWKFTVDPGAYSVVPVAASPANGVTINEHSAQLSWYLPAQSSSALSYDIELADNEEFNNSIILSDIEALNTKAENLEDGEYFWRVRSKANGEVSEFSSAKNFKVGNSITSVEDKEIVPTEYSLDQNYPNPFNPNTTISYSLPEASYVTIKIYNMLGQEVKTLLQKEVTAGKHNVVWNGENDYGVKVTSGTYIYRIVSGDFVQTHKMVLLK